MNDSRKHLLSPLTPSTVEFSPSKTDEDGFPRTPLYPPGPPPQKLHWKDAIGGSGWAILLTGLTVTLLSMALLIFLWTANQSFEGRDAPALWRWIVLQGKTTPAITFTSLLLRVGITLQAGLCTSLVAALLLQRRQVPLAQVAQFSALRSGNTSPDKLMMLLIQTWWAKRFNSIPIAYLCLLFLGSVAIQFSSTILVQDLGDTSIVGSYKNQSVNPGPERGRSGDKFLKTLSATDEDIMNKNAVLLSSIVDYSARPQVVTPFGQTELRLPTPDSNGVSDTGLIE
ncbi:uncharacterized protein BCR38DRAFT_523397 [Pseudomassariella vexata]|uniref:Uncharacterized protein n=1 Tax=Pseudomassariella vexata TaxID=1141098 RepID=A0A1Y2E0E0_9PEZI|nr:uncharacterized protein BCR38DRAFT_523397 [Pseudomassariella vexata]ORY64816.1 hypothetical protein BCR38DRAFT_523397 [Pseudomassariella vexata]